MFMGQKVLAEIPAGAGKKNPSFLDRRKGSSLRLRFQEIRLSDKPLRRFGKWIWIRPLAAPIVVVEKNDQQLLA